MSGFHVNKFIEVSWDGFNQDTMTLGEKLKALNKTWKGILCITRGGMVASAILGEQLGLRVIETISIVGYKQDDTNPEIKPEVEVVKPASGIGDGEGWIVVDDMVDTGRTIDLIRKLYPKAHVATVYVKPMGKNAVDTYTSEVTQETWIYFPWVFYDRKARGFT